MEGKNSQTIKNRTAAAIGCIHTRLGWRHYAAVAKHQMNSARRLDEPVMQSVRHWHAECSEKTLNCEHIYPNEYRNFTELVERVAASTSQDRYLV